MSLNDIKRALSVDQTNILVGRVLSVTQGVARVRLADGRVVRAGSGSGYQSGATVQLHTDGSSYSVAGSAPLSESEGEIIVHV